MIRQNSTVGNGVSNGKQNTINSEEILHNKDADSSKGSKSEKDEKIKDLLEVIKIIKYLTN